MSPIISLTSACRLRGACFGLFLLAACTTGNPGAQPPLGADGAVHSDAVVAAAAAISLDPAVPALFGTGQAKVGHRLAVDFGLRFTNVAEPKSVMVGVQLVAQGPAAVQGQVCTLGFGLADLKPTGGPDVSWKSSAVFGGDFFVPYECAVLKEQGATEFHLRISFPAEKDGAASAPPIEVVAAKTKLVITSKDDLDLVGNALVPESSVAVLQPGPQAAAVAALCSEAEAKDCAIADASQSALRVGFSLTVFGRDPGFHDLISPDMDPELKNQNLQRYQSLQDKLAKTQAGQELTYALAKAADINEISQSDDPELSIVYALSPTGDTGDWELFRAIARTKS